MKIQAVLGKNKQFYESISSLISKEALKAFKDKKKVDFKIAFYGKKN